MTWCRLGKVPRPQYAYQKGLITGIQMHNKNKNKYSHTVYAPHNTHKDEYYPYAVRGGQASVGRSFRLAYTPGVGRVYPTT